MKIVVIVIGALILGMTLFIIISGQIFHHQINQEGTALLEAAIQEESDIITEKDLEGLPEPVQRYLRFAQVVGKRKVSTVRLKQTGSIKMASGQEWTDIKGTQYFSINPPALVWKGEAASGLISITAKDSFTAGKGHMQIKLFSTFTIGDETGPSMDQGAFIRFLSEIMWFPTAFLSDYITWEAIDEHSARIFAEIEGQKISAVCYFDTQGRLINFKTLRYRSTDTGPILTDWEVTISDYKEFNGIIIPTKGKAIWKLKEGDFEYVRLEITEIEYNTMEIY